MGFEITRTELVWPGKYDENGKRKEPERVSLPFQVIERVKESRATRVAKETKNMTLFDYMTPDPAETFEEGWRNKLIWGDNLLVMSSLLDQFAGKVDLIYIDPPFATGADFSMSVAVGDESLELRKDQSVIEEKAYRDIWGHDGNDYVAYLCERFKLMRELLATNGVISVHVDWRVAPAIRLVLDEIFGPSSFINELIWRYGKMSNPTRRFAHSHDQIMVYARGSDYSFNPQSGGISEYRNRYERWVGPDNMLRYGPVAGSTDKLIALRVKKVQNQLGRALVSKDVLFDFNQEFKFSDDVFTDISIIKGNSAERTSFPTQKPELLVERVTSAFSNAGDLVADLFVGSGTTAVVAEKLGRRWIGCDLGRFAIHTTRKRLLGIEGCKPFEVLNLGKYERQYWSSTTFGAKRKGGGVTSIFEYVAFVLKLYRATPAVGLQHLHGRVGSAFVHVGAVDSPVTIDEIKACITECAALKASELHILGWEWEMGLHDLMTDQAKARGVKLVLRQIPREVMERQAADKGDVTFFELAYLEVAVTTDKAKHQTVATLRDFVIPNPELVPDEVRDKITKWSDYVDYWAVDWDFADDTFMQGWVTYRTRKDRTLALCSDPHTYDGPGDHAVMVKVIDIFGNDTSRIITVEVP